jgi:hypothetical protein
MIAQQGAFLMSLNVASDIEQILETEMPKATAPGHATLLKLRIPAGRKGPMMKRLRGMNVTASSLFPGLDGIGRYLDERVRYS